MTGMDDSRARPLDEVPPYGDSDERPPWVEEAADPTWWDVAFGSYGDGYLEWVHGRYFWDPKDVRTVADTRSLWRDRWDYVDPDPLVDRALEQARALTERAPDAAAS